MITLPKPKMIQKGNIVFISWVDKINKQMKDTERKCRLKAVKYLKVRLKQLVKNKYGKGDLYKGIDYYHGKYKISKIGFRKPAYHAHLIELGTDVRWVWNYKGHKGLLKEVGKMDEKPFFRPFLNDESENVKAIIENEWLHNVRS